MYATKPQRQISPSTANQIFCARVGGPSNPSKSAWTASALRSDCISAISTLPMLRLLNDLLRTRCRERPVLRREVIDAGLGTQFFQMTVTGSVQQQLGKPLRLSLAVGHGI